VFGSVTTGHTGEVLAKAVRRHGALDIVSDPIALPLSYSNNSTLAL
jgi:hypothetical protein